MKKTLTLLIGFYCLTYLPAYAQSRLEPHVNYIFHKEGSAGQTKGTYSLRHAKSKGLSALRIGRQDSTETEEETYPSIKVGALMHLVGTGQQQKPTNAQLANPNYKQAWERQMWVYRGRILVGGNISEKTSFFLETELPSILGAVSNDTVNASKNIKVSPILLDAQVEHIFNDYLSVIAGLQLVGNTRNGLQSAASLMALDFGYFQYPYNLFASPNQPNSALQGNFGRDIGVNLRGFLVNERLEYRLGVFAGRTFDRFSPLRIVGRFNFNFLDTEKDLYYTGTTLGEGNIFAIGGGIDAQTTYRNIGVDMFLDKQLGDAGSITLNAAFNSITGGDKDHPYSFAKLIPRQTIHFAELGYYFYNLKLLPYFKYENQIVNGTDAQYGLQQPNADFVKYNNILNSNMRIGGGIGYYFGDYNSTVKLSYESVSYGHNNETLPNPTAQTKRRGEIWLQLQLFVF
jgi:hypothetical protein